MINLKNWVLNYVWKLEKIAAKVELQEEEEEEQMPKGEGEFLRELAM